jgi:hypothetical protein
VPDVFGVPDGASARTLCDNAVAVALMEARSLWMSLEAAAEPATEPVLDAVEEARGGTGDPGNDDAGVELAPGVAAEAGARPEAGVTCCTFTGGAAAKVGAGGISDPTAGGGVTATGDAVPVGVEPIRDELTISRLANELGAAAVGLALAPLPAKLPEANSTPTPTAIATMVASTGNSNRRPAFLLLAGSLPTRHARRRFGGGEALRRPGAPSGTTLR